MVSGRREKNNRLNESWKKRVRKRGQHGRRGGNETSITLEKS